MSKLEEARVAKGLTQEVIAAYAGIAVSTYSQYENGQRSVPLKVAERIAEFVGCDLNEIFLPKKFTVSKSSAQGGAEKDELFGRSRDNA